MNGLHRDRVRFIPACAGNVNSRWASLDGSPVHPRVCGERVPVRASVRSMAGSSPRVRGTLLHLAKRRETVRFIPACAGNVKCPMTLPIEETVHPRVCGERIST